MRRAASALLRARQRAAYALPPAVAPVLAARAGEGRERGGGWPRLAVVMLGMGATSAAGGALASLEECVEEDGEELGARDRFQFFDRVLGEGAFGVVKLARDRATGKRVAVKIVRHGRGVDVSNEVKAMRDILSKGGHDNLLQLIEVVVQPTQTLIVTELVSGGEVFDKLVRSGPFSESDVARMALSLAQGVRFLHKECETAHCDLKPENILFTSHEEDADLKIVDFGSARRFRSRKMLVSDIGTTVYWAPENFSWAARRRPHETGGGGGSSTLFGPEADMFAIGCILYICLYGSHPFDEDGKMDEQEIAIRIQNGEWSFDDRRVKLSASAKNLIRGLLESDPRKRLTADEMLSDPWVRGETASDKLIAGSAARLEDFQRARRRVQAWLLSAMIQQALNDHSFADTESLVIKVARRESEGENHVLRRTFDYFDKDGKGFLTPKDVTTAMAELGDGLATPEDVDSVLAAVLEMPDAPRRAGRAGRGSLQFQHAVDILSELPRRRFADGDTVFRQGDRADNLYFVMSGEVEVLVSAADGAPVRTAALGPGHFFGESGLLSGCARSATIRCTEDTEVLVLGKRELEALQGEATFDKTKASLQDLAAGRTLHRLHSLFKSSSRAGSLSVPHGQKLFLAGDAGEDVFLVEGGAVSLYEARAREIACMREGALFGETAVMTGRPRNATAVCTSAEGCALRSMAKEAFLGLIGEVDSAAQILRTRKRASFDRSMRAQEEVDRK